MVNGPFKPIKIVDGETFPKEFSQWTPDENKRAHYDVRAKNIISSSLTLDEFYRVSVCESPKRCEMSWKSPMRAWMRLKEQGKILSIKSMKCLE